jgi:tetratricopeptide (TPR) repeat protein
MRPRFQLALADFHAAACADSVEQYQKVAELSPPTWDLLLNWGLAYDCAGNSEQAIAKLQQAVALRPSAHTYSQLGREYGKSGRYPEALDALANAQRLDPSFAMTYYTLGDVHQAQGDLARAREDYQRTLSLDPNNEPARAALARMANIAQPHPSAQ